MSALVVILLALATMLPGMGGPEGDDTHLQTAAVPAPMLLVEMSPAAEGSPVPLPAASPVPVVARAESSGLIQRGGDNQYVEPEVPTSVRFDEPVLFWLPEILVATQETGVSPSLIAGVIRVESQGIPLSESPVGAQGLMQVMPFQLAAQDIPAHQWSDPATNILAGAHLLKWNIEQHGTHWDGIAHYFGIGCDVYTCTDDYVTRVLGWEAHYAPLIADSRGSGLQSTSVASLSVTAERRIYLTVVVDEAVVFDGWLGSAERTEQFVGSTFVFTTSSGVNTDFTNGCGDTFKMGHEEGAVHYTLIATESSCTP